MVCAECDDFLKGFIILKCPRRSEVEIYTENSPFLFPTEDTWIKDHCSYCGSMSPEKVFEAIHNGQKLTPTDKNYKIYIGRDKFYFQHFDDEQKKRFIELMNQRLILLEYPGYFYVLPFFCQRVSDT